MNDVAARTPPSDLGAPTIDERNPWLGLASFTEETRAYFYGREDEVERRDLVIVEIACGEQHHAKCSGDEQEGGGESARVWPEVRLRLRSGSAGHENEG